MKHDEHIENAKSFSEIFDQVEHFLGIKLKAQKSVDTLLEAVIHYYEALIGCMPGNVYWLNKKGYTVGCNQNVLAMFGLQTLSQFRGLTFEQLGKLGNWSPEATQSFKKDTFEVIKTGIAKVNIEEPSIPDQYGRQVHFLTHRVPLFDQHNHVVGVVGISVDVSERKHLLDELRTAKEHAEAANHTKSEFIANMSHDLRTPLAGIIGISNLLENKLKTPEEKHEAHMLYESGNSLMGLCNGILEMASLENANETEVKPISFSLGQELLEVCRLEMPALKMKGLDIVIELDPKLPRHIITDKIKLQRILLNFLGNAIKFTEKGRITLEVKKLKEVKSELVLQFTIADTGIGIPKSLHKKIFDRFYRISPSYKGMHPGFGVGLALVKHYVELLGGNVHLESEPGFGSIFSFTLPVQVDAEKEEAVDFLDSVNFSQELAALKSPVREEIASRSGVTPVILPDAPNVLLVEDNLTVLHVLESSAQKAGCQVTAVTTGEEGFALTSRIEFDLIICDIGLPGISGIEMTKQIRALENSRKQKPVPIVALTGHAAENAEHDCLRAGMNKVLTKPITLDMLMALLTVFTQSAQKKSSSDVKVLANKGLSAEKASLFILDKFPVLDIELAKAQLGGHLSLLVDSLTMLVDTLPLDKAAIIQAYEARDWEAVEKLAHRMKGGAVYCGASRMMFACQYLERYRKAEGDGELLPKLYEQLLPILEETEKTIDFWLEANRPIH